MLFYVFTGLMLLFYYFYPKSKWEASVILFTALIVQGALLGESDQFLGFIDHRSLVVFLVIFNSFRQKKIITIKNKLDLLKSSSIILTVLIIILLDRYIDIKAGLLFGGLDYLSQMKRILRDSIYVYALYQVIKRMYDTRTIIGLENGLLLGMVLALTSMVFYDYFLNLGFSLHKGIGGVGDGQLLRLSGFLGLNANAAASLFTVVYGFLLAKTEHLNKLSSKYIILFTLCLIAMFIVASRTGLITVACLTIIYFYRTSKSYKKMIGRSLAIVILMIIIFIYFGDYLAYRMQQQITGEFDTLTPRTHYWQLYLTDIANNPEYLVLGNLGKPTYHRSVHSTYIHILFYTGIFYFTFIVSFLWKIYKRRNIYVKNNFYYTPLFSLLAILVSWITGAGTINYWWVMIIAASSGIPEKYLNLNSANPERSKISRIKRVKVIK
jgi:hypothetical protein